MVCPPLDGEEWDEHEKQHGEDEYVLMWFKMDQGAIIDEAFRARWAKVREAYLGEAEFRGISSGYRYGVYSEDIVFNRPEMECEMLVLGVLRETLKPPRGGTQET